MPSLVVITGGGFLLSLPVEGRSVGSLFLEIAGGPQGIAGFFYVYVIKHIK